MVVAPAAEPVALCSARVTGRAKQCYLQVLGRATFEMQVTFALPHPHHN